MRLESGEPGDTLARSSERPAFHKDRVSLKFLPEVQVAEKAGIRSEGEYSHFNLVAKAIGPGGWPVSCKALCCVVASRHVRSNERSNPVQGDQN
jgi:hypothetical protein